jgi:hypothetical protein
MAPGWIRAHACSDLFDIDCDTSHPSNLIDALRFFKIPVPKILFTFVTKKTEIRGKLAGYYDTHKDKVKQLINSILYGVSIGNNTWFDENKITPIRHHDDILNLANAVGQCATDVASKCKADYDFAKRTHPKENEHKWKMTALSELLVRIEEQKLTCIITRLIDHWGINPKSIIPMHDGAMISLRNLHPEKELSKIDKPIADSAAATVKIYKPITCPQISSNNIEEKINPKFELSNISSIDKIIIKIFRLFIINPRTPIMKIKKSGGKNR